MLEYTYNIYKADGKCEMVLVYTRLIIDNIISSIQTEIIFDWYDWLHLNKEKSIMIIIGASMKTILTLVRFAVEIYRMNKKRQSMQNWSMI